MATKSVQVQLSHREDGITLIALAGDLDGSTSQDAQQKVLSLVKPGMRLILDMSQVQFMSSLGLRMLLLLYRQVNASQGKVVVTGLSEMLHDVMYLTGFLTFFKVTPSIDEAVQFLQEP